MSTAVRTFDVADGDGNNTRIHYVMSSGGRKLKEGDIVYVPPTPLAWAGLRLRELLFPFEPVMGAYNYTMNVKDAPDRWKYGSYGYYHDNDDNDNWKKQALLMQLTR